MSDSSRAVVKHCLIKSDRLPAAVTSIVVAASVVLSGCSFGMPEAPTAPYREPPACDSSRSSPGLDFLGAGVLGVTALVMLAAYGLENEYGDREETTEYGMISLGSGIAAVGFGAAAVGGIGKARRCQEAKDAYAMQFYRPPPGSYGAPPMAPTGGPPGAPPPATPGGTVAPAGTGNPPMIPLGAERGYCRTDGTCDAGLTCASNRCVVLPPPSSTPPP